MAATPTNRRREQALPPTSRIVGGTGLDYPRQYEFLASLQVLTHIDSHTLSRPIPSSSSSHLIPPSPVPFASCPVLVSLHPVASDRIPPQPTSSHVSCRACDGGRCVMLFLRVHRAHEAVTRAVALSLLRAGCSPPHTARSNRSVRCRSASTACRVAPRTARVSRHAASRAPSTTPLTYIHHRTLTLAL
jgi:hypothetical protein